MEEAIYQDTIMGVCHMMCPFVTLDDGTEIGVKPNAPLGQTYLIPFRNHGIMDCQLQLGLKGSSTFPSAILPLRPHHSVIVKECCFRRNSTLILRVWLSFAHLSLTPKETLPIPITVPL